MPETEIRRFVDGDYSRVLGLVALMLGSREAAEDALQDALAAAWIELSRGRPIDSLTAWVTAVSLNRARSVLRRRAAEARAYHRHGTGARATRDHDAALQLTVADAIARLPRRQREAVVLRHQMGLDTAAAASVMGVSEGTVKNALHRAHARLSSMLEIKEEADERA